MKVFNSKLYITKRPNILFRALNHLHIVLFLILFLSGCKKFIQIEAPVTSTNSSVVFNTDANAIAALTYLYAQMSDNRMSQYGLTSLSVYGGLSADELTLFDLNNQDYFSYYTNALTNRTGSGNFWSAVYPNVYVANLFVEELSRPTALSKNVQEQLLGEAKFLRALFYFYLTNLYGDVPLALTTDAKINSLLTRTDAATIWQKIITDLKDAKDLLSVDYLNSTLAGATSERVRPTKAAATALLARSYLYIKEWVKAEEQSSLVLNNPAYDLETLNGAFIKESKEAVWQLQPVRSGAEANTAEGFLFVLNNTAPSVSNPVYLSTSLFNSFEPGDQRAVNWVDKVVVGSDSYYYPYKYKIGSGNSSSVSEYSVVLRLAELYLIRAEARARQNNLAGAISDLDKIRERAGLPLIATTNPGISQSALINQILHERQVELFTEWGHRWFDLKRTGNIDAVLSVEASAKGGTWNSYKQLYPVPLSELQRNPRLTQNQGY